MVKMIQVPVLGLGKGKGKGRVRDPIQLTVMTEEQQNKRKNECRQDTTNKQYDNTLKRFWFPFLRLKFVQLSKIPSDLAQDECDALIAAFPPEEYHSQDFYQEFFNCAGEQYIVNELLAGKTPLSKSTWRNIFYALNYSRLNVGKGKLLSFLSKDGDPHTRAALHGAMQTYKGYKSKASHNPKAAKCLKFSEFEALLRNNKEQTAEELAMKAIVFLGSFGVRAYDQYRMFATAWKPVERLPGGERASTITPVKEKNVQGEKIIVQCSPRYMPCMPASEVDFDADAFWRRYFARAYGDLTGNLLCVLYFKF